MRISCGIIFLSLSLLALSPILHGQSPPDELVLIGDSTKQISSEEKLGFTGKVVQSETKAPLSGVTISIANMKYYDQTDEQGNFYIELPSGKYKLSIRSVGMITQYKRLLIYSSGRYIINMQEGTTSLDEVVVSARAVDSNIKGTLTGVSIFNMQEIKTLPSFMGEVDVVKSIQLLPGVSSVGEGSSGFNVRGGRTDQNLLLLNGSSLFNSSHALGFVSVFNPDVIQNFTLYKGNVPAQLGGRASSVLEVTTRKGDFEKWKYQGGIGLVTSRLTAEGPIIKGKTSLLIGGRTSYAGWLLNRVSDPDVKNSSLFFYDANAILSHRFNSNSSAEVSYYSSHDSFRFSQQFGYSWDNYLTNFKLVSFSDRKVSPTFSASFGSYKSSLINPSAINASVLSNVISYFHVKESIDFKPSEAHEIIGGIEAMLYLPKPETIRGYNGNTNVATRSVEKNRGLETSMFLNDDFKISENIGLSIGIRYSFYQHLGKDSVFVYEANKPKSTRTIIDTLFYGKGKRINSFDGFEPRVSARFNISSMQSIKISYNRMRQYIHLISNTTAPTPVDLWQVSNEFLPPQVADNFSAGYFLNLKENSWETSVEFFYKKMDHLVEYKDFASLYLNNHLETELLSGKGKAYGGEVFIRKIKGLSTGWLSYTYSRSLVKVNSAFSSETINEGQWYSSNYDRPHNFNLVTNLRNRNNGAFSFILSYATGRPFTAIESSYITDDIVVPLYSNRNEYKIPDYIRLDLSFTFGNVFKKIEDSLAISIYNLLGRENAYSVFYQRPSSTFFVPKAYKLSILGSALPSITYNFKF